jgi:hypothetical protein
MVWFAVAWAFAKLLSEEPGELSGRRTCPPVPRLWFVRELTSSVSGEIATPVVFTVTVSRIAEIEDVLVT